MIESVRTIAVLGAGTMGSGIAHVAALGGFPTRLFDTDKGTLKKARQTIENNLDKGVQRGKVDADNAARAKELLELHHDLAAAVRDVDLVIEAVPEQIDLKISVFQEVDVAASDNAVLASNTSALSITELAAASGRPERFAGMHFFNPVHIMKLIELVRGLETSEETLSALAEVSRRMGKETVTVNESPGFVTSRINALIGNEAFRLLQEGVASAQDIDRAIKLGLNHPMGPFEMGDLVGLDVRLSILEHLQETLGDHYRPNPLLQQYVKAGHLGRKTGRGVYSYDPQGQRID